MTSNTALIESLTNQLENIERAARYGGQRSTVTADHLPRIIAALETDHHGQIFDAQNDYTQAINTKTHEIAETMFDELDYIFEDVETIEQLKTAGSADNASKGVRVVEITGETVTLEAWAVTPVLWHNDDVWMGGDSITVLRSMPLADVIAQIPEFS